MTSESLVKWFHQVSMADVPLVGGKNASLGEMIQKFNRAAIRVPNGFAITTIAYEQFLRSNNLSELIAKQLNGLRPNDLASLARTSSLIKEAFMKARFDQKMSQLVKKYYEMLLAKKAGLRVAVRSSASAEDLPTASFAGLQDTYLHVSNLDEVMTRIKDVYASLFGERALAYRAHHGFSHEAVTMSVGVQAMVNSDIGQSGVMFSLDPETGFKDCIFINSSYGLGEAIVSGAVNPDEFMIYKPAIKENRLVVLNKKLGSKSKKLIFSPGDGVLLKEVMVEKAAAEQFSLSDADLLELSRCAHTIEDHYQRPMDIEWAKDGVTEEIFILQARPETVHGQNHRQESKSYGLLERGTVLCEGRAVGKRIGQGRARLLWDIKDAHDFQPGDVLVTDMTEPNWEPIMNKASAIVTNRGGRTCHAAIIARELGIAAVVGCHDATKKITNLAPITVSCAEGDTGYIYDALLPIITKTQYVADVESPVPLMLIAANPSRAFSYRSLPHKGIGLARLEFIIGNSIGIHPNALLQLAQMPKEIQQEIHARIKNFSSPKAFYVETLTSGIATLAAVAHPHPIIVRLSDFKTNEYEELLGGSHFENKENNPMIGFRGASRYISPLFREAFALECLALKRARENLGFKNIEVMVPFVRTLEEAKSVISELESNGLKRGENGLRLIMMCEVPSNVILADRFLDYFDGFSIGSNDLTQLTLGVDRDSEVVSGSFSESDEAVLAMLTLAINACKKRGKYIGICGQGPSDDINLARFLISKGIDSISLTPDTIGELHMALSLT